MPAADTTKAVALTTTDMDGYICTMEWENYYEHLDSHPELDEKWFWPQRVIKTLKKPHLIIDDKNNKQRHIYYRQESVYNVGDKQITYYTKVVIDAASKLNKNQQKPCTIITAWHATRVKETGYSHCKVRFSDGTIVSPVSAS